MHLGPDESPVESRVVRHEHPAGKGGEDLIGDFRECWRRVDHLLADTGEFTDAFRNRPPGIHQRFEHDVAPRTMHDDHGDFGNAIVTRCLHAGGFHVHHGEGALLQQR